MFALSLTFRTVWMIVQSATTSGVPTLESGTAQRGRLPQESSWPTVAPASADPQPLDASAHSEELVTAVATDGSGNVYLGGVARAEAFLARVGSLTASFWQADEVSGLAAFLLKLDSDGDLVYATLLGPLAHVSELHVDADGAAYAAGVTTSPEFPSTVDLRNDPRAAPTSPFVLKVDATGARMLYGIVLGGGRGGAPKLAVDPAGNAYVAFDTQELLPTTSGVVPTSCPLPCWRGLVVALDGDGERRYATYLPSAMTARDVALDLDGHLLVAGQGWTPEERGWVLALGDDGTPIHGATWGSSEPATSTSPPKLTRASVFAVAVDPSGIVHVSGSRQTFVGSSRGPYERFVAQLSPDLTVIRELEHVPVNGPLVVTRAGDLAIPLETTCTTSHPLVGGGCEGPAAGANGYFAVLDPDAAALTLARYFGGSGDDVVEDAALLPTGELLIVGWSSSPDFPERGDVPGIPAGFMARFDVSGQGEPRGPTPDQPDPTSGICYFPDAPPPPPSAPPAAPGALADAPEPPPPARSDPEYIETGCAAVTPSNAVVVLVALVLALRRRRRAR